MAEQFSSRQLRRSVRRHVESMGSSPGEIAGWLAADGVRGIPAEVSECVLARYLQAVIGTEVSVRRIVVKERSIRLYRAGCHFPAVVALPLAVSRFIRAFDAGCYPELIDSLGVLERGYRPGAGGTGSPTAGGGSKGLGLFS